MKYTTLF